MNVFITGVSSGIGKGLAEHYLELGHKVLGVSRRKSPIEHGNFKAIETDLTDYENLSSHLNSLFDGRKEGLDLVVLNAGALGKLGSMKEARLKDMKETMEINLWSQKVLLDELYEMFSKIDRVVAISSGAAVNGNLGWNGYSLSKAALNMLIQLYAAEKKETQFIALAPGLVDTAMQDYLWTQPSEKFPSLEKIHSSRGSEEKMPNPNQFAPRFVETLEKAKDLDSGSFIDIRQF